MNNSTHANGRANGGYAEQIASLRELLAQVESQTDEEHAPRRQALAQALRSVIEKHE